MRDRQRGVVAELFFSYSAKDRERVRPIYEALAALGFDVSWDQLVPAGGDWDTWIREQLADARCVVVFWSLGSVASDNIRHEATIAKEQGKFVPVMVDPLRVGQFPMGLFNTQAARLIEWSGDGDDPEWRKLLSEIENKLMPVWAARRIARLDAELKAEGRRRETAQAGEDAAEAQLAQEIAKQGQLRRDRERAQADAETARAELSGVKEALDAAKAQNDDMAKRLASAESQLAQEMDKQDQSRRERERAQTETAAAVAELGGLKLALDAARAQNDDTAKRLAAAESQLAQEIDRQDQSRRDRERAQTASAAAVAELGGLKLALDAARVQNDDTAKRLASAESVVASEKKHVSPKALAGGVVVALVVGATVAYFAQEAAWTKREALAVNEPVKSETQAEADAKKSRLLQNTILLGTSILPKPSAATVQICRTACLSTANCRGFDFNLARNDCRIYSVITHQYSENGMTAGRWD
jgi:hypothetical protein